MQNIRYIYLWRRRFFSRSFPLYLFWKSKLIFQVISFSATMVTQRSEQRCRRSWASRHFSSWSVHGRLSFRRRESERRGKVFLRKAKRYNGQKCSAHPATRLGVYEGENTSLVFKLLSAGQVPFSSDNIVSRHQILRVFECHPQFELWWYVWFKNGVRFLIVFFKIPNKYYVLFMYLILQSMLFLHSPFLFTL